MKGTHGVQASIDRSATVAATAASLALDASAVSNTIELLDAGATLPFIARYRKERTGGLDEVVIASIEDAWEKARALVDLKNRTLKSIAQQGALSGALERAILAAETSQLVRDLALPYKSKRKTRAGIARERGLEPLAAILLAQTDCPAGRAATIAPFVDPAGDVSTPEAALQGACDIVAERWSEDQQARGWLRKQLGRGDIRTKKKRGGDHSDHRFESFYDHREPLSRLASHRYLAMRRGEAKRAISLTIEVDDDRLLHELSCRYLTNPHFLFRTELRTTVNDCYGRLLKPSITNEVLAALREVAETRAIDVFAANVKELVLASPASGRAILGIDPGFRTGCKAAVVDRTGRLVTHTTLYPTAPRRDVSGATAELVRLLDEHAVELIAIGNGTASRETAAFCATVVEGRPGVSVAVVSEAGASVYSASAAAREEFPDLDLTVRGAISIARRVQDPLAELVKIDPKAIGVGQYQHDVNQAQLQRMLDRVVSSAVNHVGVDVNTASTALLSYVSGIGPTLAQALVVRRNTVGPFATRRALLEVPRFGAKAFEQSAGFLRVRGGREPLDASAVHPESYYVVRKIAKQQACATSDLLGNQTVLQAVDAQDFVDERVGVPTVRDILQELAKPGRDPRQVFEPVHFADGVTSLEDLVPGLQLEGVVTNVTHFGAFVDVGVHQDGLVHISELDRNFVRDPTDVVKVGDHVQVEVVDVDVRRQRIGLSRKRVLMASSS